MPIKNKRGQKTAVVDLNINCMNLYPKTVKHPFKNDLETYAVVAQLSSNPQMKAKVIGKTEITGGLSPRFVTPIPIEYDFWKETMFTVTIFDVSLKTPSGKDRKIGQATFELGDIFSRESLTLGVVAHHPFAKEGVDTGIIYVRAERKDKIKGTLTLKLNGHKLKNTEGLFRKSDPFVEVAKEIISFDGLDTTWVPTVRTDFVKDNLSPDWEEFSCAISRVVDSMDDDIRFNVFDHESSGAHVFMGSFEASIARLQRHVVDSAKDTSKAFELHKLEKGKRVTTGKIVVTKAEVSLEDPTEIILEAMDKLVITETQNELESGRPKFVDYLDGGAEIKMSVAIDFTGSNGDPRKEGTLHYFYKDGQLNDYQKVITGIGSMLSKYDADNNFPLWGFGAKVNGEINHCFNVGPTESADGVAGILEYYRQVWKQGIIMSGPTDVSEVIEKAAATATEDQEKSHKNGGQCYTVLVIITDGAVSDVNNTKRVIRSVNQSPLSIVIIGVGNADFRAMEFLDDFAKAEKVRDTTQFVEFNVHAHSRASLCKACLEEIPEQVVDYFTSRHIKPLPSKGLAKTFTDFLDDNEEEIDVQIDMDDDNEPVISGGHYDGESFRVPPKKSFSQRESFNAP